jgi:hypothetical protein
MIYLGSPLAGILCAIVLAIIVYLALRLAPCWLLPPAIFTMALWDLPPLPVHLLAPPLPTGVPPQPTAFRPVGPLILQVSPPPGSSDPEEF